MINYIKSLFPWRWTALAIIVLFLESLYYYVNMSIMYDPTIFLIVNIVTIFILDLTIGVGRESKNQWLPLLGVLYLILMMVFLIFDAYIRFGIKFL